MEWDLASNHDSSDLIFILQQSSDASFDSSMVRYEGPDQATYLSGLAAGNYFFRVMAKGPQSAASSSWSQPFELQVVFIGTHQVILLSLIGLAGFTILVVSIMVGHRLSQREPKVLSS